MKKREDFNDNLKWKVEDIYPTEADFFKEYEEIDQKISEINKFKDHILDSNKNLLDLLNFDNEISKNLECIIVYAHLLNDQDTTNPAYQKMYGQAVMLYEKYRVSSSFIIPEILKSDFKIIEKYLKEEPKLQEYKRVLKEIFKFKPHVLSAQEEELISNFSPLFTAPDDIYSYLTDADLKFGTIINEDGKKEELTEKSYHKLIESNNRKVRKNAFNKLFKVYGNFKNTYASLLASEVKKNNRLALVKKYPSARYASLFANDIPEEIYDNLIKEVRKNISPLSKYWLIKKKALGVDKLHLYDTYAPILKEVPKRYTEKEAQDLIMEALSVLGPTYLNDLKQAFTDSWIDFCPNDGKRNGAYCTACYQVHPYVLLSFDGSLNSVSTLIHELGHAMHYYYAIKNQKYQDYNYSIFVAEVASQVNQIILSKYLINKTDNVEEKKYLIDDLIQDFKATIYRQTMFAEFEYNIHALDQQGQVLTYDALNDLYYKLNKHYYGKNIVVDKLIATEWQRIPHFYMDFYVYQYATAYAAAIKIAMDILNKKPKTVDNYLKFLSLGATLDPISSLKVAGVDMSKPDVLKEAFNYFNDLVDELAKYYQVGDKNE